MAKVIDLELLQLLEDKLGKDEARKVAKAIELGLEVMEKRAEELALQKKLELRDELTKELASKADLLALKAEMQAMEQRLEAKIELVRKELGGEINKVKTELSAKIENEILRLDRKFTIMFIILFFTLILVNQNALEFLLKALGLIR
jgi:hypothetical protein